MKILGVIPSRFESSRFPGKPLIDLKGKSMIQRVYEQAQKATLLDDVIVATDDQRIYEHVISFGGKVQMTNKNHPTGTDRCGEVAQANPSFDVVVNIQGDEPLIVPDQIDQLCRLFEEDDVNIATLAKEIDDPNILENPNRIKIALGRNNKALYFSRSPVPYKQGIPVDRWLDDDTYYRHIGIYAFRSKTILEIIQLEPTQLEQQESLEQLRWLYNDYDIYVGFSEYETPNIDVPADVDQVLDLL